MEYTINLETLTPVHTGSGNDLSMSFDLVHFSKENCLAVISTDKVFEFLGEDNIDEWVKLIEQKKSITELFRKQNLSLSPQQVGSRIIRIEGKPPMERNTVKEHFMSHAEQKPTLSGSSIKGAIRTAYLTQELIYKDPEYAKNRDNLGFAKNNQFVFKDAQIIAHYMGNEGRSKSGEELHSPNKDLFRFVRVSDFYFDSSTVCIKQNIINQTNYGWGVKDRETCFVECIPSNTKATGRIQLPDDLLKAVKKFGYVSDEKLGLLSIENIFKAINTQSKELVADEIDFWNEEENPNAIDNYLNYLDDIKQKIEACKEGECVLRLGAGSGWDFMTGGWAKHLFSDADWTSLKPQLRRGNYPDSVSFPKTRKLLHNGQPLGFIKMTIN
jgi:CRISPR-associated protein Csm5